ncbi:hypothetical protein ACN47E_010227 [Coniothyrium glycines]
MPGTLTNTLEREPSTGIDILVVGGGIGGLTFAIEAYRKGHDVRVLERNKEHEHGGEPIMVLQSALQTPKKWPGFMERARALATSQVFETRLYDGAILKKQEVGDKNDPSLAIYRKKLQKLMYEYSQELGIPITYEQKVVEYFESDSDTAGVVLADGSKQTADLVVAADGVGSRSRIIVDGFRDAPPISSGFILYRASYPNTEIMKDPMVANEFEAYTSKTVFFHGPGAHIFVNRDRDLMCWLLTCKDDNPTTTESWSKPTSISRALAMTEGWHPLVHKVINATPGGTAYDWKLMWRDPQPSWISRFGRVVQIGDAAHPFLPTSISGGTMAMEDGYSLATCLALAGGKTNVGLATRVHNKLRFERVSCAQKLGFKNREIIHAEAPSEPAKPRQAGLNKVVGDWIPFHDPEKYANTQFAACKASIDGSSKDEFKNTNAVPGYTYKPWSVREMLEIADKGETIQDEGEWW